MTELCKCVIQYFVKEKRGCCKIIFAFSHFLTLYITYVLNTCSFKRKKWKNIYQSISHNYYPLVNRWLLVGLDHFFAIVPISFVMNTYKYALYFHSNQVNFNLRRWNTVQNCIAFIFQFYFYVANI